MVIKLGIIGISEGNGHPFSFSAIVNGYSEDALRNSGWEVIYDYVSARDLSEFGFDNVEITHAWTQDIKKTKILCKSCLIPNAVSNIEDMIDQVDGVIIARDDYGTHYQIALPFLEKGLYVFVDKPLSLNIDELRQLMPYLESGKLMSCSGMRYAKELDEIRQVFKVDSSFKMIRGIVVNSWDKYGVHLLDAIFSFIDEKPISVRALKANHESMSIRLQNGQLLQIDCIGNGPKVFRLDIITDMELYSIDIKDNFSMFRRTIWHFIDMIKTGDLQIDPNSTQTIMKLLIAGNLSLKENREVFLEDIEI